MLLSCILGGNFMNLSVKSTKNKKLPRYCHLGSFLNKFIMGFMSQIPHPYVFRGNRTSTSRRLYDLSSCF